MRSNRVFVQAIRIPPSRKKLRVLVNRHKIRIKAIQVWISWAETEQQKTHRSNHRSGLSFCFQGVERIGAHIRIYGNAIMEIGIVSLLGSDVDIFRGPASENRRLPDIARSREEEVGIQTSNTCADKGTSPTVLDRAIYPCNRTPCRNPRSRES